MNPQTPTFQERRAIEDALAPLADAQIILRAVITRMAQRARTDEEAKDILELVSIRRDIETTVKRVSEFHQDCNHAK